MDSRRDLGALREDVENNVRLWLSRCEEAGLPVLVTDAVRDNATQAALYAQGRTSAGDIVTNSKTTTFHGAGLAVDFCKNVQGEEYDDADFFRSAAALAKEMGFSSGMDWESFPDPPHLQWDEQGGYDDSDIRAGRLPPPMPLYAERGDRVRYQSVEELHGAYHTVIVQLMDAGLLRGREDGTLDLSEDMVRIFVVNYRAGLYDAALQKARLARDMTL